MSDTGASTNPRPEVDAAHVWHDFGFRRSPYGISPILTEEEGSLLVGRENELNAIFTRLATSRACVTLDGPHGVGKSSLITVALLRAFGWTANGQFPLLIPLRKRFDLAEHRSVDALEADVYREVVAAFHEHEGLLRRCNIEGPTGLHSYLRLLEDPVFENHGGGVSVLGSGVSIDSGSTPNDAIGFAERFPDVVRRWLDGCFGADDEEVGGFVGVLDNVERAGTTEQARRQLEAIRDRLLMQRGLRWIISGARQTLARIASTQLDGVLLQPLEVGRIDVLAQPELIQRRVEAYRAGEAAPYVPVGTEGFTYLYEAMSGNLRNTLQCCEDFSRHLHANAEERPADPYRHFRRWFEQQAAAAAQVTPALSLEAWQLLLYVSGVSTGVASLDDYGACGFSSREEMEARAEELSRARLLEITRSQDGYAVLAITRQGSLVRVGRDVTTPLEEGA